MNSREIKINFIEYLYKNYFDPEMDDILISYGAIENTESLDGFYASMSQSQLLGAATAFYTRYKNVVPELKYLFCLLRINTGIGVTDELYIDAFRDGYSLAGKDYTKLDEILGL